MSWAEFKKLTANDNQRADDRLPRGSAAGTSPVVPLNSASIRLVT
jgi:hypothetical protein